MGIQDITGTIATRIHTYSFNTREPEQLKAYEALHAKLQADGPIRDFFNAAHSQGPQTGYPMEAGQSEEILLETKILFNNQWNTAPNARSAKGYRVFDWYEGINFINGVPSPYKSGHYLEITDEMRDIRANTLKCGYCGTQYDKRITTQEFCTACLDNVYLKEDDLRLLRLHAISVHRPQYAELSEAEREVLMPEYIRQQTTAQGSRAVAQAAKARAHVEEKYIKANESAQAEHDGMLWLLDHHVNVENVIYYAHTHKFSFGWRTPLEDKHAGALLDILFGNKDDQFKWAYEMKRVNS